MAIRATLESFFLELCSEGNGGEETFVGGGETFVREGGGGGGGNTLEQGFKGRPHKKEFPKNEELGNF